MTANHSRDNQPFPYRSRPLLHSSYLVLPSQRPKASTLSLLSRVSQTSGSADKSTPRKSIMKTLRTQVSEHSQTGSASCETRPSEIVASADYSSPEKVATKLQHLPLLERRVAGLRSRTPRLHSQGSGNYNVMESAEFSTKTSESDLAESETESLTSLEGCEDVSSPLPGTVDLVRPSRLSLDETTLSPISEHDEVSAPGILLRDGDSLSELLASLKRATLHDNTGDDDLKPSTKPEPTCKTVEEIIFKECDMSRCENGPGIRMRAEHFEVRAAAADRDHLHSVSDPQPVLIRAKGDNNRFLVNETNTPSMTILSQDKLGQAVFQKQEFFDENLCKVVTSFCHLPTQCYLGISADTMEVKFFRAVSESDEAAVVSLNGPLRPDRAPDMADNASSEGPDPCCLFLVMGDGYNSIQPAICHNKSLHVSSSDGRLRVVDGQKWSFKLLPASRYFSKADLKKLMKKSLLTVMVVSRRH